MMGYRSLGIE